MMRLNVIVLVALGGATGTLGRYGLAVLASPVSRSFPWATIGINVIGSFVIGGFSTLTLSTGRLPAPESIRLFVLVGLCGGFTTFSSFSLQTFELLRAGQVMRAAMNITLSVLLCLMAVAAGHLAAAGVNGPVGGRLR